MKVRLTAGTAGGILPQKCHSRGRELGAHPTPTRQQHEVETLDLSPSSSSPRLF